MDEHGLLRDLVIVYSLALVFVVGLARLKVPAIVAMIVAGALAGPSAIGLISTQEEVDLLAEIGVVLLLFAVGLDFSLAEVRRTWRSLLGGGLLQITLTATIIALLAAAFGAPSRPAVFMGLFVALSSTAIVLKALSEQNQLSAPFGRLVVGVLLFQDLCIVVLLLLVPILSGQTPIAAAPVALLRAGITLAVVVVVGRLVLPPLLQIVARSGRREAFALAILLASVGTAWLTSLLGVSMALGAFLAGLVLADSEFSHQAYAEIRPLRDILASLFFVSLGMLLDFGIVADRLAEVSLGAGAIILVKAVAALGAFLVLATPLRVACVAALSLAQVGEFSFILGRAGLDAGLIDGGTWQVLLGASILTMMATPVVMAAAPRIAAFVARGRSGDGGERPEAAGRSGHVLIVGYGLGGRMFARALAELQLSYLVMELNAGTVKQGLTDGVPIIYGDAANPDSLRLAGVSRAAAVVAAMSDPDATLRLISAVRSIAPGVPIIARTRYALEARRMETLGAAVAVAEELETSLEVLAHLLNRLRVPDNRIQEQLDRLRHEAPGLRPLRALTTALDEMPDELRRLPLVTHQVRPDDWCVGRTLAEIHLRASTGVSILVVGRAGGFLTTPRADEVIAADDVLYLSGAQEAIGPARRRLGTGE